VGSAIWQNKCCIAVVVGQRTPVCRADLHRCICPGTSLCQPVLHSSTEQWGLNFAKTSAALQWWWVSAHLYAEQICTGVSALVQACCQPGLQSSPEQWGVRFGKFSAALQWWWVSAHLYAEQICLGVSALLQACCQPGLRAALSSGECILPKPVLHCGSGGQMHTCMHSSCA